MLKQKHSHFFLLRASWWSTLLAGAVIGITSQRIPELKRETDAWITPIARSELFQELRAKVTSHYQPIALAESPFEPSHYTPAHALPGHPLSSFIIHRSSYSLAYDARTRNPSWVYEHLTADHLQKNDIPSPFTFKEDENLPEHLRTTLSDYKGQGLDQGQMAPTTNHATLEAIDETFYLTNICPQCPQLNRDYWSKLEKHARDLTHQYPHVYVITGPLYLPYQEGKRRFIKYQVIGSNDVAVPSHFYKVIMLEDEEGKREVQAYILPNAIIPSNTPLDTFRTTAKSVEKAAGILFFSQ